MGKIGIHAARRARKTDHIDNQENPGLQATRGPVRGRRGNIGTFPLIGPPSGGLFHAVLDTPENRYWRGGVSPICGFPGRSWTGRTISRKKFAYSVGVAVDQRQTADPAKKTPFLIDKIGGIYPPILSYFVFDVLDN